MIGVCRIAWMAVPPPRTENGVTVGTTTKKELVDRIADLTGMRRTDVRDIVQLFLDGMVEELADGNRLEFRDFWCLRSEAPCGTYSRKTPRLLNPSSFLNEAIRQSGPADEDGHGRPHRVRGNFGDRRLSKAIPATAEVEVLGAAGRQAEVKPLASSKKKQVQPKSNG